VNHDRQIGRTSESSAVAVTVDLVIFTVRADELQFLVERGKIRSRDGRAAWGYVRTARPWTTPLA